MRLALIIYGSLDTISGGYLYDRMLVEYLRRQGDEVEIVSLPWKNYGAHLAQNFLPELRRLQEYDAVLQDELNHPSLFIANRLTVQSPPIISIVHHLRSSEQHPPWHTIAYTVIERLYLNSVDGFIFNSQATKTEVEDLVGEGWPSVMAHPAGSRFGGAMALEVIQRRATRPGPLKVLFVGNVIPRKGLDVLMNALAQIEGGWTLDVVGSLTSDEAYAAEMQGYAPPNGNFHGAVTDTQLADYYAQSDVLVVPSSYEGFGIVYLEAMGFGVPAIGTSQGGASEIITHGQDGFLIEPGDSDALAAHLRALAEDRVLLLRLSVAARERFLRHPGWDESMAKVRGFVEGMIRKEN